MANFKQYLEPESNLIIEDSDGNEKWKISGSGDMTIDGNIIPKDTGSNNIGSESKPFHDLYVTTESIKFVEAGSVVETMTKDDFTNIKEGRYDRIAQRDITIDGNFIPASDATYTLGTARKRFSRLYVASTIDVSGSELVISAPSASAVGDPFNVVVSGSILPANSDSHSIGSEAQPFKDLYITTGSIIYVDRSYDVGHANRKVSFSKNDVQRLREGKPLRATDSRDDDTKIRGRMTNGLEITGSLVKDGIEITSTGTELNILDGLTATTSELNIMDGVTATTTELNIMDGVTATTSELNIMDGVTATTTELNKMDGVTVSTANINSVTSKLDGSGGTLTGPLNWASVTMTAGDATPDVRGGNLFITANTDRASADITTFDGGRAGQEITVIINDNYTDFSHDARALYLQGGRDWTTAATGDTITFVFDGTLWYEKCRSDNS